MASGSWTSTLPEDTRSPTRQAATPSCRVARSLHHDPRRPWPAWGAPALAVSALVCLIFGQGPAMLGILIVPKLACLAILSRSAWSWGCLTAEGRARAARWAMITSLASLVLASGTGLGGGWARWAILADAGAMLVLLAIIPRASGNRAGEPIGDDPTIPAVVRSWFRGRIVVLCGSDLGLQEVLARRMRLAGAVVRQIQGEAGSRDGRPLLPSHATALVVADQDQHANPSARSIDAITTRRMANESLRRRLEVLARVTRRDVLTEPSVADRVLEAFSGLARTRFLALSFPRSVSSETVARRVLRDMATAHRPRSTRPPTTDSGTLWQELDRLERQHDRGRGNGVTVWRSSPGAPGPDCGR